MNHTNPFLAEPCKATRLLRIIRFVQLKKASCRERERVPHPTKKVQRVHQVLVVVRQVADDAVVGAREARKPSHNLG